MLCINVKTKHVKGKNEFTMRQTENASNTQQVSVLIHIEGDQQLAEAGLEFQWPVTKHWDGTSVGLCAES